MSRLTPVEFERAIRMLQANVTPLVIDQQCRCHFMMIERLWNRLLKMAQLQTVRVHDVIVLHVGRDVKIDASGVSSVHLSGDFDS